MPVELTCACGKSFHRRPCHIRKVNCCSRGCADRVRRYPRTCVVCAREWMAGKPTALRCSIVCKNKDDNSKRNAIATERRRENPEPHRLKSERYRRRKGVPPRKIAVARTCRTCAASIPRGKVFCSRSCNPKRPMVVRVCESCGASRKVAASLGARRCWACWCSNRKGADNSNWKGGKRDAATIFRKSPEYAAWRTSVFSRDGYKCRGCGQIGGELQADHIKPFAMHPELRLSLDNGRTLCRACHEKTDTYLYRFFSWKRQQAGAA